MEDGQAAVEAVIRRAIVQSNFDHMGLTFHVVLFELGVNGTHEFGELRKCEFLTGSRERHVETGLTITQVSLLIPLPPFSDKKSNHHCVYLSVHPPSISTSPPSVELIWDRAPPFSP